jgi:DNA-binding NtrC family response regulator
MEVTHQGALPGGMMPEKINALLVQTRPYPLDTLRLALEEHAIDIRTARNCGEAALALWSDRPPHLVFTEARLSDGNWANILTLAAKACAPVNVIVVAPERDLKCYIHAVVRGAFGFIVPPFSDPELLHIVGIAAENALSRRREACSSALRQASLAAPRPPEDCEIESAVADADD